MNVNKNWSETKNQIKKRWNKFTDQDLDDLDGDIKGLPGKIQKTYHYDKNRAEQEVDEFSNSLGKNPSSSISTSPSPLADIGGLSDKGRMTDGSE